MLKKSKQSPDWLIIKKQGNNYVFKYINSLILECCTSTIFNFYLKSIIRFCNFQCLATFLYWVFRTIKMKTIGLPFYIHLTIVTWVIMHHLSTLRMLLHMCPLVTDSLWGSVIHLPSTTNFIYKEQIQ